MNANRATLLEVKTLAEQRHWMPVVSFINDLLVSREDSITIASPANVDASAFCRWVAQHEPDKHLQQIALEDLAQDPSPAMKAGKLLAVFRCGTLLGVRETDALARAFFCRPGGTYTIALLGAEQIAQEDELDFIERGFRRLLVADANRTWDQQALSEYGCYLWSDSVPADFLRARLQRDQEALVTWLHTSAHDATALEHMQALYTLELADEFAEQAGISAPAPDAMQLSPRNFTQIREQLVAQKQRFFRRLDDTINSLERQLTTSLLSLEQELLYGLHAYLQQNLPKQGAGIDAGVLKRLITDYITTGAAAWEQRNRPQWEGRTDEIAAELEYLLQGIDWTTVNTVARQQGYEQSYPNALLRYATAETHLNNVTQQGIASMPTVPLQENSSLRSLLRTSVVGVLSGSGVLAAMTFFLGFAPVQLIVAGAVAVFSGVLTKEHLERTQMLQVVEQYGRTTISAVIHEAINTVQERIRQEQATLRSQLIQNFRVVETMLDAASWQIQQQSDQADKNSTDRQFLERCRRKIAGANL